MVDVEVGQIRVVRGGYGLMKVIDVDLDIDAARMLGHGSSHGHWFEIHRLSDPVGPEVVLREREQARIRNVGCNDPDCWCREVK